MAILAQTDPIKPQSEPHFSLLFLPPQETQELDCFTRKRKRKQKKMASSKSSSTPPPGGTTDAEREKALDQLLTVLAFCEDDKLHILLSRLLPFAISSLSFQSSLVRNKVSFLSTRLSLSLSLSLPISFFSDSCCCCVKFSQLLTPF